MIDPQHKITEIYRALELEVYDRQILRQGGRIDLLLDTVDFEKALLGLHDHVVPKKRPLILSSTFDDPATLADSLVASGWLGSFRMLPPHQTEFLRHLESRSVFQNPQGPIPLELRDEFLRAVGLLDADRPGQPSIRDLRGEELLLLFKKQAEKAERSFKAVQAILYSWAMRLKQWKQRRLFGPCGYEFDYPRIVNSGMFGSIMQEFERVPGRERHTMNNFADAVALAMLVELSRRAKKDPASGIPRFFDSSGTFLRVARAAGIENDLLVVVPHLGSTRVLVTADYLIYKATFSEPPGGEKPEEHSEQEQLQPEDLLAEIREILGEKEERKLPALETIEIRGRKLGDIVNDFVQFSFLKNVWLEQLAEAELEEVAHQLELGIEETAELELGAKQAIELTTQELRERADAYEHLSELWLELRAGAVGLRQGWRRRIEANPMLELDAIRDLDLVRFCIPERIRSRVKGIADGLLRDLEVDDFTRFKEWEELVDLYLVAAVSPLEHPDDAEVMAAFLWKMRNFRGIIRLLRKLCESGKSDASMDVFFAASCFRRKELVTEGKSVLDRLTLRLQALEDTMKEEGGDDDLARQAIDLSIGVGYLRFHYWYCMDYAVEWRHEGPEGGKRLMDEEGRELLWGAAECVRSALHLIQERESNFGVDSDMSMKEVYALNQKLYYMTEAGAKTAEEMREVVAASATLLRYETSSPQLWQPTYHDTLARYFHLLATRSKREEDRSLRLKKALWHCEEAMNEDPDEGLFRVHHGQLLGALPIEGDFVS